MSKEKRSVLIVEDDPDIRESIQDIAELDGFQVYGAENGKAALDLLEKIPRPPGLILLDLMMPVMDGQTFMKHLKDSSNSTIPVVIISAAKKDLSGSFVEIVEKPADARKILNLINKYCS